MDSDSLLFCTSLSGYDCVELSVRKYNVFPIYNNLSKLLRRLHQEIGTSTGKEDLWFPFPIPKSSPTSPPLSCLN